MADEALTDKLAKPLWARASSVLLVALLGILVLLNETATSLFDIWWRSETYTHGVLIGPIALWLVWKRSGRLAGLRPSPSYDVFFLLALAVIGWALARLTGVLVIEQFALIAILVLTVWGVLGHRVARQLAFPLLFLFLAVPIGEDLVPPMMEFTATFTVWMLQMTGIPVYRDGLNFVIPSGSWSVVEACSGIRYLIASVTLGVLYAYLSYRSLWRRILFVVLSVILPIVANGLRAYLIVMIGHLSDMQLAVGVDHLVYGWVFFGIVMLLLFWAGSLWSEPAIDTDAVKHSGSTTAVRVSAANPAGFYVAASLALGLVFGSQLLVSEVTSRSVGQIGSFVAPHGEGGWVQVLDANFPWNARVLVGGQRVKQLYQKGDNKVFLDATVFPLQRQDAEAVSSQNVVAEADTTARWRISARRTEELSKTSALSAVNAVDLTRQGRYIDRGQVNQLLVWQWYRMGEYATAYTYLAKVLAAANLIYPGRTDGVYVTVATSADIGTEAASALLEEFVADMGDALNQRIDAVVLDSLHR